MKFSLVALVALSVYAAPAPQNNDGCAKGTRIVDDKNPEKVRCADGAKVGGKGSSTCPKKPNLEECLACCAIKPLLPDGTDQQPRCEKACNFRDKKGTFSG